MKISNRGINLIKRYEGLSLKAYKPVKSEPGWTIGYGHHGDDVHEHMVITEAHATRILHRDLTDFERGVDRLVTVPINQNRFDALVALAFNIGLGNFANSTVLRETNRRHYIRAAAAFAMWTKGGNPPKVLLGLVKRRASEARLYRRRIR